MATYKVLQDIEAEDRLVGPLTLKQLIYAGVAAGLLGIGWWLSGYFGWWFWALMFLPSLPFIFLAIPLGQDQPNDVWLLAKLNYLLRPRKRIWQQGGLSRQVVFSDTGPKDQQPVIDSLSPEQFDQRLASLAQTLDQPRPAAWVHPAASSQTPLMAAATINQQSGQLENYFDQLLVQQRTVDPGSQTTNESNAQESPNQRIQQLSEAGDFNISTIAAMAQRE